jgi:hypothetical protein
LDAEADTAAPEKEPIALDAETGTSTDIKTEKE